MRGQLDSAANVHRLLEGSSIIESHRWCDKVQDAYSLRCAPQVHGASRDLLDDVETTVAIELNAATDNPLVLVDEGMVVSNGNFHGQPLAFGLDTLAMAVAELANISERRVERLVNPSLSDGLPPFLTREGGLNSGFMITAVRGGVPGVGEQVALPPGERRLDPDERRPGGSRVDGERCRAEGAAGAGQCRAGTGDRAARRRAGDRVPGAARARRPASVRRTMRCGSSRSASVTDRSLAATTSSVRGRGDPATDRILAARREPRSVRCDGAVSTLEAAVEGASSGISPRRSRLPRGTQLNAGSWQTEAPLRMLLNNLDAEVAERPEELVVYGGSGRAARSHDALRAIVRTLLRLRDDETLLVQSGKPVGVFRTHEGAPRVLIANSLLVPRWATWDEFRRLEAEGLTMFGQMTAGSWIYIGTQGILQGTYQTFAAAGEVHFGSADLSGRTILTAGLGGMGGAQPLAATMAGAAILCIEVDPSRIARRLETRYLDEVADSLEDGVARVRAAAAEGRALSVAVEGNAAEIVPELARKRESFDLVTDQTAAHDPLTGYVPVGLSVAEAASLRAFRPGRVPPPSPRFDREARRGTARVRPRGQLCLRLWQQPSRGGL